LQWLIEHPATMTHVSVPAEMREAMGIAPDLIRIWVGIEDVRDLIADPENALDRACNASLGANAICYSTWGASRPSYHHEPLSQE
jgi:Cys/Met metabolism PLP-dependent enzyme